MTASGNCHKCGKVAAGYHYTKPRLSPFDPHEGFWHCEEHGPKQAVMMSRPYSKDQNFGLNRAERRALKKRGE